MNELEEGGQGEEVTSNVYLLGIKFTKPAKYGPVLVVCLRYQNENATRGQCLGEPLLTLNIVGLLIQPLKIEDLPCKSEGI